MDDYNYCLEVFDYSLEIIRATSGWEIPLLDFFVTLQMNHDDTYFHPHLFTIEETKRICNYRGRDLYYIVINGNRVLGYGILRGWDAGYDIPSLGVALHPQIRGMGVGKAFILFLHHQACRYGAKKIRLKVYSHNIKAVNLYSQLGYKFIEQEGDQLIGYLDLSMVQNGCRTSL